jgi:hypothetical protein
MVLLGPAYAVLYKSLHHLFILNLKNDKTRKSVLIRLRKECDYNITDDCTFVIIGNNIKKKKLTRPVFGTRSYRCLV